MIAAIASRQRGIVTRAQLRAARIGDDTIDRMARSGRLHRMHPGVFAVGHQALAPLARETAALLALGEGAYLSHLSAAALWGMLPTGDGPVDVLLHPGRAHARAGIRVHRTSHLEPRDSRLREYLPVTSPARTLLDLADVLTGRPLEKALEEAWAHRLVRQPAVNDVIHRANGRRGAKRLSALLGHAGTTRSFSGGEDKLLALLRQAELPLPIMNAHLHGHRVDYYWPKNGLVLELDSIQFHSSRPVFERDRRKTAVLTAAGLRVMHATGSQLDEEPLAILTRIAQALVQTRAA